jgi:hypothetical protein
MPNGFRINPLPDEITSWISCILHNLPETKKPCHKSKTTNLVSGVDGSPSWPRTIMPTTPTSADSTPTPNLNPSSSEASPKPFDLVSCSSGERRKWLGQQCELTSTNWYRPFGMVDKGIHLSTQMDPFRRFYRGSSPVSGAWTRLQNDKKQ